MVQLGFDRWTPTIQMQNERAVPYSSLVPRFSPVYLPEAEERPAHLEAEGRVKNFSHSPPN